MIRELIAKLEERRRSVAKLSFSSSLLALQAKPSLPLGKVVQVQPRNPLFMVWNISFNTSDYAPRGFLFGLLKLCSFQIPAGFSELASYGP
jgi:hypothetical protein